MREINIPNLSNFLPNEQEAIKRGDIPYTAECGAWREATPQDQPHPSHVLGNTEKKKEMIPIRLYGPGTTNSTNEFDAVLGVEYDPTQFRVWETVESANLQSLTTS